MGILAAATHGKAKRVVAATHKPRLTSGRGDHCYPDLCETPSDACRSDAYCSNWIRTEHYHVFITLAVESAVIRARRCCRCLRKRLLRRSSEPFSSTTL